MTERDATLKNLIVPIPGITQIENKTEMEYFQNSTLRPILKYQNDGFIQLMTHVLSSQYKVDLSRIGKPELEIKVKKIISSNTQLRFTLLGIVVGMMNSEEIKFYLQNERAARTRIFSMLQKRLIDRLHK